MIHALFALALFCLPMTSIAGLPFLGEIQHEVSAYVFLVLMALFGGRFVLERGAQKPPALFLLPRIFFFMLGVIALSFVANIETIRENAFLGRGGIEKFFSATLLVFYGFGIAFLTYFLSASHPWDALIVKPLAWSVVACAAFSFFEMAARYGGGAMRDVFDVLSAPFYGDMPMLEWDVRLRSFAFEPPDFANTAGYIWPWLLGAVLASRGAARITAAALFVLLSAMLLLSGARTGLVLLGGLVGGFLLLRQGFFSSQDVRAPEKKVAPVTVAVLLLIFVAVGLLVFVFDEVVFKVVAGESVSNLSRLASMTAALRMFEASPLYGFGFGQFGFHATQFMPAWGFYSPEIRDWLFGAVGAWPAVYSVYARFAADMGLPGVIFWAGLWLWLARTLLVETLRYRQRTGTLPFAAYPLILSCFAVLLAGIPCDSVRAPMIWVNLGLACRYLASLRGIAKESSIAA